MNLPEAIWQVKVFVADSAPTGRGGVAFEVIHRPQGVNSLRGNPFACCRGQLKFDLERAPGFLIASTLAGWPSILYLISNYRSFCGSFLWTTVPILSDFFSQLILPQPTPALSTFVDKRPVVWAPWGRIVSFPRGFRRVKDF